jgi:peptidyl-prolyl cis-trans isomerase C
MNLIRPLLREPLLHFLLIGTALFGVYRYVQPATKAGPSSRQIQLSLDELSQMVLLFQSQWKREPTVHDLDRLVENKVQVEILYREGLEMGLDKGDEIVKRRLAQKMQFLAEDVAASREPTTAELKSWYAKNTDKFAMPTRVSFRHLYFSPDHRGHRAREDAVKALAQLGNQPEDSKLAASLADPFMFQEYYRDRAPDFLGKEFGPKFAQAVAQLAPGSWRGPIESGFGWHLVFVDSAIAGNVPAFEEIEQDVKTAWLGDQKALSWEKAYKEMRAKYTVLIPSPPQGADVAPPTQAATLPIGTGTE